MSVRRPTSARYYPGAEVHSVAIGNVPEFDGVIVEQVAGGWNVLDAQGRLWLRRSTELANIKKGSKSTSVTESSNA